MEDKKDAVGAEFTATTSSKEWEDFSVHKAINKTLACAYDYKYKL